MESAETSDDTATDPASEFAFHWHTRSIDPNLTARVQSCELTLYAFWQAPDERATASNDHIAQ